MQSCRTFPTAPTCRRTPSPAWRRPPRSAAPPKPRSRGRRPRRGRAARLATLDGDPAGQQVAMHLAALDAAVFGDGEPLLARAQTALADLPKRRSERDGVLAEMAAIATRLAGPEPCPTRSSSRRRCWPSCAGRLTTFGPRGPTSRGSARRGRGPRPTWASRSPHRRASTAWRTPCRHGVAIPTPTTTPSATSGRPRPRPPIPRLACRPTGGRRQRRGFPRSPRSKR